MRPRQIIAPIGAKIGNLRVIKEVDGPKSSSHRHVECVCDCGDVVTLRISHLYADRRYCSRSCKLLSKDRIVDLTGRRFGKWEVVAAAGVKRWSMWMCVCQCGAKKEISQNALVTGNTSKCLECTYRGQRIARTPEEATAARRRISRESARRNPARRKANKIKYLNRLASATPAWLTPQDWDAMNAVYEQARKLTRETGVRHEVDHIYPLNGKTVCGLHVPSNLQILTQAENVAKSNRYAELYGDIEK